MVTIKLRDKETGEESKEVSIDDVIFNQGDIIFEFGDCDTDSFNGEFPCTLSYKGFLCNQDDYEVVVVVK